MTGSGFVPLGASHDMVMGVMMTPVYMKLNQPAQAVPAPVVRRGVSAQCRAARIAANSLRTEGIRNGRVHLAASLSAVNKGKVFLTTLRLAAGLSQSELGQLIGMKQPNVARLEKQPGDLGMAVIRKLATALATTTDRIIEAADNTNQASAKHD